MIVRESLDSYALIKQHDHALASGVFATYWAKKPRPRDSTLYAIAHHDVAWRTLDARVLWNEETGRPYSFVDYPPGPKVTAYAEGLDWLEERDPYAACLCSMHYETLVRRGGCSEVEERFAEAESQRQGMLRAGMSEEDLENLDYNLRFLRLCDGLSLFVCLHDPGGEGPPPFPEGFELDGEGYLPIWKDRSTLRLDPNPFAEALDLAIPYLVIGKDRRLLGEGQLEIRVVTSWDAHPEGA